jgi:hypothetical protein
MIARRFGARALYGEHAIYDATAVSAHASATRRAVVLAVFPEVRSIQKSVHRSVERGSDQVLKPSGG